MTFQELYTRFTDMSRNTATSPTNNQTLGKQFINESQALIVSGADYPFLYRTANISTVAGQSSYELPAKAKEHKIVAARLEASADVKYRARLVNSVDYWEYLESRATSNSDVLQFVFIQEGKLHCYPTPATSSLTIRVRYMLRHKDMTQDDYSTGTIQALANGATTVTGVGTTWTDGMAGNHMRITRTAAAGGGDGYWYEIDSRTSDTVVELVKNYEGATLSAASAAYTIGELPLIPESHDNALVYRSLALYYMQNAEDKSTANQYWSMYDGGYEAGHSARIGGILGAMNDVYLGSGEAMELPELPTPARSIDDFEIKDSVDGESW